MTSHKIAAFGLLLLFAALPVAVAQESEQETLTQRIDRLIGDLGADGEGSYDVRERAQRELEAIGKPAIPALEKASKSDDLEVASRATDALATIRKKRPTIRPRQPVDKPRTGPQPGQPDMDEVLKELERQLPEGFGKIFKEFFKDQRPPQPGEKDEERRRDPFRPRTRTWTWQLGPDGKVKPSGSDLSSALGLRTGLASAALRAQLEIPKLDGRVVNRIVKGGYAERSGIKLYDVIVAVDGRPVRRTQDLQPLLSKGCKVEVYRKAKLMTLEAPAVGTQPAEKKPTEKKPAEKKPAEKKPAERKQRSF